MKVAESELNTLEDKNNGLAIEFKLWPKLQELLPLHSESESKTLKANIETFGVLENGVYWDDKYGNHWILDGVHRNAFSKGDMQWKEFHGTEEEALDQGVLLNVVKRNLTSEQIIELQEKMRQNKERRRGVAMGLLEQGKTQEEASAIVGVPSQTISDWKRKKGTNSEIGNVSLPKGPDRRVSIPKSEQKNIYSRNQKGETHEKIAADYKVTRRRISQIVTQVKKRLNQPVPVETPDFPEKIFSCIVIDPPWPMKKSERTARPNQGETLDYATMTLKEIGNIPIKKRADPNGCHIYLWTTQKYLPWAFQIFKNWGVKYHCLMTWVKPTAMTPFSFMFNTEHVLFGRIGSLDLLKFGVKLSFNAPSREHSRKPEVFYDIVREVSPGPRLNMYARGEREGFEPWGSEKGKFGGDK